MSGLGFNPRAVETQRGSIPPQWRHPPATRRNCFCACWESNPGHKHGRLVCCHYTTCAHATRKNWKGARVFPLRSARNKYNSYTLQRTHPDDTLAEWLRRRPAKPMGSPCVGSNPTGVVCPRMHARRRDNASLTVHRRLGAAHGCSAPSPAGI